MLGVERGALIGKRFTSLVTLTDPQAFRNHLQACFSQDARSTTELSIATRGRAPITVQLASTRTVDELDGSVTRCRTALTDVTALKRSYHILNLLANASQALSVSL